MANYNYGAPCLSCLECHGGMPCQAPHEGGLGKRGLAAWAAVHEYAVDEADLDRLANQWLGVCTVVNLTPHTINVVVDVYGRTIDFPPSGTVARVTAREQEINNICGCPVVKTEFDHVVGLPDQKPKIFFLVSRLVLMACPDRADLVCPGTLIRDNAGQPKGCNGLSR